MEVLKMGIGENNEEGTSSSSVSVGDHEIRRENAENIMNGCNYNYWTNERHLSFLSSMEETFVRNMMQNHTKRIIINAAVDGGAAHHHHRFHHRQLARRLESFRLDRFVPDISESTLDLHTSKKSSSSVKVLDLVSRSGKRQRGGRSPTRHPYKISLDQVVPHAEEKKSEKDEEERVRPHLPEMII